MLTQICGVVILQIMIGIQSKGSRTTSCRFSMKYFGSDSACTGLGHVMMIILHSNLQSYNVNHKPHCTNSLSL